jgi:hypothetical protein
MPTFANKLTLPWLFLGFSPSTQDFFKELVSRAKNQGCNKRPAQRIISLFFACMSVGMVYT